jgi:hypothetical protein
LNCSAIDINNRERENPQFHTLKQMHFTSILSLLSLASASTVSNVPTPTVSSIISVPSAPQLTSPGAIPTFLASHGTEQVNVEFSKNTRAHPTASLDGFTFAQQDNHDYTHHGGSMENIIFTTVAGASLIMLNSMF